VFDSLFLAGGAFWIVTYLLLIRVAARERTYGMPLFGVSVNLAWEFTFSLIHPYPGILHPAIMLWFGLDLVIVYQTMRYGPAQFADLPRRLFYGMFLLALAMSVALVLTIDSAFHDPWGVYCAYFENLMFSSMFLAMLYQRRSEAGQSPAIAFCKLAGTGLISLAFGLYPPLFPGSPLLRVMFVSCFVLDTVYLIALLRVRSYRSTALQRRAHRLGRGGDEAVGKQRATTAVELDGDVVPGAVQHREPRRSGRTGRRGRRAFRLQRGSQRGLL
jgi:hypothetical protein